MKFHKRSPHGISFLKLMFGDMQMSAPTDMIQAALMLSRDL